MNKKIRVLHVVGAMNIGGIENFIMNIYRNINKDKVQFDFVVHQQDKGDYDDEILSLGGHIYRISSKHDNIRKNSKEFEDIINNKYRYKIVHNHISDAISFHNLYLEKKNNIPIRITHSHSSNNLKGMIRNSMHLFFKPYINYATTIKFACSDKAARWLYGENTDNIEILPNGIDIEKFAYNPKIRKQVREEFKLKNEFVIGHVGRLAPVKNQLFILKLYREFLELNKQSKLIIVGAGELEKELKLECKMMGIEDKVIFTGSRNDIHRIMQALDTFLLPSFYEGFPVSLVEAQVAGLPCFVSDTITRQCKLTNHIEFISIKADPNKWAKYIFDYTSQYQRKNEIDAFSESMFNIKKCSEYLEKKYIELYNSR